MPTYVAFLRAINLGATRQFRQDAIVAAAEAAGCTGVATHINTGNVRVSTSMRSRSEVEAALEQASEADRGFAVPTIAFTPREVRDDSHHTARLSNTWVEKRLGVATSRNVRVLRATAEKWC